MTDRDAATDDGDSSPAVQRCDYCRLAIPEEPVTAEHEGVTYRFCSAPCRETLLAEDRVFTEYHAARRFDPGVSALRAGLPQGIPRNSFVLVSGQPGTRDEALFGELVWRALQRGEPAVVVPYLDTPVSLVQEFVALGWNVLPYLADGRLQILDCFTYRLDDPESMADSMSDWNRHLHRVAERSTTRVRDPSNPQAVLNGVENCLDDVVDEDDEKGVLVIDSLTEFGSLVQPVQAYDFVKDLRASVPKARTIPVFAGASRVNEGTDFPHNLGYVADGVIDLTLSDQLVEDALMKRIRVRKMSGVRSIRRWATYEFAESRGLVAARPDAPDDERDGDGNRDGTGEAGDAGEGEAETSGGDEGGDESAAAGGSGEGPESPKTDEDVTPTGDPEEHSE
jgi:KaiC/GvpD/RAD55 family RecA-like ATPase